MNTLYDLPEPSNADLKQSKDLTAYVEQKIKEEGPLDFATFMSLALYHQTLGYYNRADFTLGEKGDFTTAPMISPLFAHCFANQCQDLFETFNWQDILELGAGTGQFAYDLLNRLATQNHLPRHYYIYEISLTLRQKQQAFLKTVCPEYYARIIWLDKLPQKFYGIVIANEVLDALPAHCFRIDHAINERLVSIQNGQFSWCERPFENPYFHTQVEALHQAFALPQGYGSEINLTLNTFIQDLTQSITEGVILFSDYGYGRAEYYHPERSQGTLTCFYKHYCHNNPFKWIGLQDISVHVDFTRVVELAVMYGWELKGFTTQAGFLFDCGLMQLLDTTLDTLSEFKRNQAIKTLILPSEMGETIKVMALGKNLPVSYQPLIGFQSQDRRREL